MTPTAARTATRRGLTLDPYLVFIVGLVGITLVARTGNRVLVVLGFLVLAGLASWLNDDVQRQRRGSADGRGLAVRALVQLAAAGALFVYGVNASGRLADAAFFVGLAAGTMAVAALISEGRHSRHLRRVGPWCIGAAVVGFAVGGLHSDKVNIMAVGGGLLLGEFGTELTSELSHRCCWLHRRRRAVLLTGAATLLLVFVALCGGGTDPSHAVYLIAALLVVVWMAASDSDSLLLVLVAGMVLVWASAPRTESPALQPKAGERYFLALGDSYISGEGASRFAAGTNTRTASAAHDNECRRANTAWPVRLAKAPPIDLPHRVLFLACSGAVTENLHLLPRTDEHGRQQGPAELAEFQRHQPELGPPAFVVVSIGGNDAGFGRLGMTCLGPGSCPEIGQQFLGEPGASFPAPPADPFAAPGRDTVEPLAAIADDLDGAYARIRRVVGPTVPVIAVPYPIPLATGGSCPATLLDRSERQFVATFARELNRMVASAAGRNGFFYMDTMENALVARGNLLCNGSGIRSGLNFLALNPKQGTARDAMDPRNWVHNSLHPNEDGHDAMRDAAADWFERHPGLSSAAAAGAAGAAPVQRIKNLAVDGAVPQCAPHAAPRCRLEHNGWLNHQVAQLYRSKAPVIALAVIGAWLFLAPALWFGRERELSVAKVARCALRRTTCGD